MKKKVSIDIEESLLEWIEKEIDNKNFESLSHAFESSILYQRRRFGKGEKSICIMCEKKFLRGWFSKAHVKGIDTKGYGICQRCLQGLYPSDASVEECEKGNMGIFLDWMVEGLKMLDEHNLLEERIRF